MKLELKTLDFIVNRFFVVVKPWPKEILSEVDRKFSMSTKLFSSYFLFGPLLWTYWLSFGYKGDDCPLARGCVLALWETQAMDEMLLIRWGYQNELVFFTMVLLASLSMASVFLALFWLRLKSRIRPNSTTKYLVAASLIVAALTAVIYPGVNIDILLRVMIPLKLIAAVLAIDLAKYTKRSIAKNSPTA